MRIDSIVKLKKDLDLICENLQPEIGTATAPEAITGEIVQAQPKKVTAVTEKVFDGIELTFINHVIAAQRKASEGTLSDIEIAFLKVILDLLKARKREYKERTKSVFTPSDYKDVLLEITEQGD